MKVYVSDPNPDVRSLIEIVLEKLGFEQAANGREADAIVLEPSCEVALAELAELGDAAPPVVCLSIYPREIGFEPAGSVAYLQKPLCRVEIGNALRGAFAA